MFKEYYNPLCNFATSLVRDRKLAQDVVQDVFTHLWEKKDNLKIVNSDKSYLFKAVKNRSFELLKKAKMNANVADNYSSTEVMYSDSAIEEQARNYLLKEKLYTSIRQLPTKCQEIFVLSKMNGLTYTEIAEELNISVKTVENQIGRGYLLLREIMKDSLSEIN